MLHWERGNPRQGKPLDAAWPRRRAGAEPESREERTFQRRASGWGPGWGVTWKGARREPPPVRARGARPAPPLPSRRRPYLSARLGRRSGGAAGRRPPVSGPAGWGPRTSPTSSCSATHSGWAPRAGRPAGEAADRRRAGGRAGARESPTASPGSYGGTGRGREADVSRGREGGEAGGGGTPRWTLRSRRGRGACGAGHRGAGREKGAGGPSLSLARDRRGLQRSGRAGAVPGGVAGRGWAEDDRGVLSPPPALEVLACPQKLRSRSTPAPSLNWMLGAVGEASPPLPSSQPRSPLEDATPSLPLKFCLWGLWPSFQIVC